VPERRGQAFGLYILEALASGVPVVLPRSGAAVELLEATGGGTLYEPNDPPSLAAALAELLADAERARDLGARGRQAVLEKFNAERIAGKLVGVFQEVASRPAGWSTTSPARRDRRPEDGG
jgi:glycosyltransferase involved in cell wall biosynthesis